MPTSPVRFAPPGWRLTDGRFRLAAYYVAFGPHGPRAPIDPPGSVPKIVLGVSGLLATAVALFYGIRAAGAYLPALYVIDRRVNELLLLLQPPRRPRPSTRSGRRP